MVLMLCILVNRVEFLRFVELAVLKLSLYIEMLSEFERLYFGGLKILKGSKTVQTSLLDDSREPRGAVEKPWKNYVLSILR